MSTTVKYKGNIITTVNNNTKTLKTAGKYMEDDVELTDTSGEASVISIVDELDEHGGTIRHINAVSLEGDTVSAEHLEQGYTAHNSFGEKITGTLVPGGGGGNYQSKTGITPFTSSQTIIPDGGYATNRASISVGADSATVPSAISGTSAPISTGTKTLAFQTIYSGTSAPSSSIGANGDIYIKM